MKTLIIATIFTLGSASTAFAGGMNGAKCAHAAKNLAAKNLAAKQARVIANQPIAAAKAGKGTAIDSSRNN